MNVEFVFRYLFLFMVINKLCVRFLVDWYCLVMLVLFVKSRLDGDCLFLSFLFFNICEFKRLINILDFVGGLLF